MKRKDYLSRGPIAVYSILYDFGVYIYDVIDDYVICATVYQSTINKITRCKVMSDYERLYFYKKTCKIYLDECIRTA